MRTCLTVLALLLSHPASAQIEHCQRAIPHLCCLAEEPLNECLAAVGTVPDEGLPMYFRIDWTSFDPAQDQPPGNLLGFLISNHETCWQDILVPDPAARGYTLDIQAEVRDSCLFASDVATLPVTVLPYTDHPEYDLLSINEFGVDTSWFDHPGVLIWGADVNTSGGVDLAADWLRFIGCLNGPAEGNCAISDLSPNGSIDANDYFRFLPWLTHGTVGGPVPSPYCETAAECAP